MKVRLSAFPLFTMPQKSNKHIPWCMCGAQRTTCGSEFSLSTTQVPGIELRQSGMGAGSCTHSHLTGTSKYFWIRSKLMLVSCSEKPQIPSIWAFILLKLLGLLTHFQCTMHGRGDCFRDQVTNRFGICFLPLINLFSLRELSYYIVSCTME